MLRRILQNLLVNAVQYTEKGGMRLLARRRGEIVRIDVWDTGPGIAAPSGKGSSKSSSAERRPSVRRRRVRHRSLDHAAHGGGAGAPDRAVLPRWGTERGSRSSHHGSDGEPRGDEPRRRPTALNFNVSALTATRSSSSTTTRAVARRDAGAARTLGLRRPLRRGTLRPRRA